MLYHITSKMQVTAATVTNLLKVDMLGDSGRAEVIKDGADMWMWELISKGAAEFWMQCGFLSILDDIP